MAKKLAYAIAAALLLGGGGIAFSVDRAEQALLTGKQAMGGYTSDAPGVRRMITVKDLPTPYMTKSSNNGPRLVARPADAALHVPQGFEIMQIAHGLANPRKMIAAPNGDLFVAESGANRVRLIRLDDAGKVISSTIFAKGFRQPFGIAMYPPGPNPKYIYVANTDSVVRFPYQNGDTEARGKEEVIVPSIPGGGHLRGGGHWTRDVVFSNDGKKMYVSIGSHSNVGDDAAEKDRADVLQFNPDGSGFRVFASGIRNSVGLAVDPKTDEVWGSVNERDDLGDNLPPDYITHFEDGAFYGWPWYYMGDHQDPRYHGAHPELKSQKMMAETDGHPQAITKVTVPDVLVQAHSASLCLTFYTGDSFPAEYHGWIFACEHGSWNRSLRTGYKVIAVPIKDGKAAGEYDDFVTGFVTKDGNVWGRPVGIAVGKNGDLFFTDDGSNSLWRVRYNGEK